MVVAVHYFEKDAGSVLNARVHCSAVAFVGLMDSLHDIGVFFLEIIRDRSGGVLGAVIDYDDLDPVASLDKPLDAIPHIGLGIVARDAN